MNFQDFKFLESKAAHAHSFYKIILFHSISQQTCFAWSFVPFCILPLYVLKVWRLSTLHKNTISDNSSLPSLILASFIIVTLSSNCRRCIITPICIVDSVTITSLSRYKIHSIFLIVSRENYPRRFILFHLAIDRNIVTLTLFSFLELIHLYLLQIPSWNFLLINSSCQF